MPIPTEYSFTRYLAAKKTVDDRALNLRVWDALAAQLAGRTSPAPLRVLEIGAGIGTMVERVLEAGLFSGDVDYTALDTQTENIAEAHRRLPDWAARHGLDARQDGDALRLSNDACCLTLRLESADAFEFARHQAGRAAYDLLVASAFLDIVNIPAALDQLFPLLKPDGLFYFAITFDGLTAFEPSIDPALDAQIESLYHADMDARRLDGLTTGGSRAGRALLRHLVASDVALLATGPSDWVVTPGPAGYPADEAYFLHFILHTVERALTGHPALDAEAFAAWVERRHQQVEAAQLVYLAHQLDVLGRLPAGRAT